MNGSYKSLALSSVSLSLTLPLFFSLSPDLSRLPARCLIAPPYPICDDCE